eukprot:CAMPEP_0206161552 /NCGR_PEP_ID=MMETSP1474-20131121/7756_1 /ASSEMBLY_ACC=CAM_ASM_001110 /TAXON_ID=97495 /ORGANISM="Imantonia sp., Strain RCC918" /LENGTH=127 /DNA_ID=CAMNT_0053563507 /DNA_START=35 /DNA_END=414 /DNA_ORIENTATION=-
MGEASDRSAQIDASRTACACVRAASTPVSSGRADGRAAYVRPWGRVYTRSVAGPAGRADWRRARAARRRDHGDVSRCRAHAARARRARPRGAAARYVVCRLNTLTIDNVCVACVRVRADERDVCVTG